MLQNNLGNPRLRMAVRLALTGSTLAASVGVAQAQQAPAAAPADAALQEVVVTGSRIAVPIFITEIKSSFLGWAE